LNEEASFGVASRSFHAGKKPLTLTDITVELSPSSSHTQSHISIA
jgi:hypothetical protein